MYKANAEFIQACADQGVDLESSMHFSLSQTFTVVSAAEAAYFDAPYAQNKLSGPLGVKHLEDPTNRMLGALLNVAHAQPDTQPHAYEAPQPALYLHGTCNRVETAWSRTIEVMQPPYSTWDKVLRACFGREKPIGKPYVQVFVDKAGTPTLMRKGRGAHPTAVLLQPVKIPRDQGDQEAIVCPPGSIVSLEATEDHAVIHDQQFRSAEKLKPPNGHSVISDVGSITGMSFARLSPLMYNDSADRNEQFDTRYNARFLDRPLEQLQAVAHAVIDFHNRGLGE